MSTEEIKTKPAEMLLHELLVHKIELEMQHEELQSAHNALQEARDHYRDLYEFAPVGYLTITQEDLISEINLTGAALLGDERTKLINLRFSTFVAPQDSDHWYSLLPTMMESANSGKQAFALVMKRSDGSQFHAHLDCLRRESSDAPPMLRVAMTDISKGNLAKKN
nr:PAS domain-containing protein [Methylomarinum sp. Ch1-1]MDP4519779.1 PAS domain-containing protein [Methylomarinum sp. Ch1-1]